MATEAAEGEGVGMMTAEAPVDTVAVEATVVEVEDLHTTTAAVAAVTVVAAEDTIVEDINARKERWHILKTMSGSVSSSIILWFVHMKLSSSTMFSCFLRLLSPAWFHSGLDL